jgi:hypothetical protein
MEWAGARFASSLTLSCQVLGAVVIPSSNGGDKQGPTLTGLGEEKWRSALQSQLAFSLCLLNATAQPRLIWTGAVTGIRHQTLSTSKSANSLS